MEYKSSVEQQQHHHHHNHHNHNHNHKQQRPLPPSSPVKSSHPLLRSISPSPSGSFGGGPKLYELQEQQISSHSQHTNNNSQQRPTSRPSSVYNDASANGDHLPSDTFSPEPVIRPRSRTQSLLQSQPQPHIPQQDSSHYQPNHNSPGRPLSRNGTVSVYNSDLDHHGGMLLDTRPSTHTRRSMSYDNGGENAQHHPSSRQSSTIPHQDLPIEPHHLQQYTSQNSQPGPSTWPSHTLQRGHSLQQDPAHPTQPSYSQNNPFPSSVDYRDHSSMPPPPFAQHQTSGPSHQSYSHTDTYGSQRRFTYGASQPSGQNAQQPPAGWPVSPSIPTGSAPTSPRTHSPLPSQPTSPRSYAAQTPQLYSNLPRAASPSSAPSWPSVSSPHSTQSPMIRGSDTIRRSLPQPPGTPPGVALPPVVPSFAIGHTPPATPPRARSHLKTASLATPLSPTLATPPAAPPFAGSAAPLAEAASPTAPAPVAHVPTASTYTFSPPRQAIADTSQPQSPGARSSLSRSDSVISVAEELMARGLPSRRGRGGVGRFGRSPLSGTTNSVVLAENQRSTVVEQRLEPAQEIQEGRREGTHEQNKDSSRNGKMEVLSDNTKRLSASTAQAVQAASPSSVSSMLADSAKAPAQPSSREAKDDALNLLSNGRPHQPPTRSSPHDQRQSSTAPASFASAQQEVATELRDEIPLLREATPQPAASGRGGPTRVESIRSAAAAIPKIHSPPPNAAPPIPSIALPDEDDVAASGGPKIAISAPDDNDVDARQSATPGAGRAEVAVPSFSFSSAEDNPGSGVAINISGPESEEGNDVDGPMISVSGPSGDDENIVVLPQTGMTPSISLSHASDFTPAMPQRASATFSNDRAEKAAPAQSQGRTSDRTAPTWAPHSNHQSASAVAGTTCGSCSKYIAGRVVQAINQSFHPACFACDHCKELLEHVAFYEHQGKAYCHFDYHELFSLRCFHCRTPIVDERFIQINDPELLSASSHSNKDAKGGSDPTAGSGRGGSGVRYYHDLHFFCANCGDPFIDPKVASSTSGSDRGKIQVDDAGRVLSGGKAFVVWKGYPYCESCHHSVHKPSCKGCRKPILYDVITALKGKWHPECFVCQGCQRPFEDERVFVDKEGRGFDEECYRVWLRGQL